MRKRAAHARNFCPAIIEVAVVQRVNPCDSVERLMRGIGNEELVEGAAVHGTRQLPPGRCPKLQDEQHTSTLLF